MEILAHTGPNWSPGSLCVHPTKSLVAIAVRNTVLLYSKQGQFQAELRAIGRHRVSALSFCSAPALDVFLAVGTSDGHLRVYDIPSRRIFRRIRQGPASNSILSVYFLPSSPHLLLVAYTSGIVEIIPYAADTHPYKPIISKKLSFKPRFVYPLPSLQRFFIVTAGHVQKKKNILQVVDLQKNINDVTLEKSHIVHDVAIRQRLEDSTLKTEFVDIAYSTNDGSSVVIWTSSNCIHWTRLAHGSLDQSAQKLPLLEQSERKQNVQHLHIAMNFSFGPFLITSDVRGTILLWQIEPPQLNCIDIRYNAHMRQIFALRSDNTLNEFYSISMDRTLAAWSIKQQNNKENVLLRWRTLRVDGDAMHVELVKSTSTYNSDFFDEKKSEKQSIHHLLYTSSNGTITSAIWTPQGIRHVFGEICPFGKVMEGKRCREEVSCLQVFGKEAELTNENFKIAVVGGSRGKLGIVSLRDGNLQFAGFKKRKSQKRLPDKAVANITTTKNKIISVNDQCTMTTWQKLDIPDPIIDREEAMEEDSSSKFQEIGSTSFLHYVKQKKLCTESFVNISSSDDPIHFIGSEHGTVLIANDTKQSCTQFIIPGFSDVVSLSFHQQLHLLAVSGASKELVICSLSEHQLFISGHITKASVNLTPKANKHTTDIVCKITWAPSPISDTEHVTDYHLLTVSDKGAIQIWEYREVNQLSLKTEFKEIHGKATNYVWCENSHVLTADCDGTIRSWEINRLPRLNS